MNTEFQFLIQERSVHWPISICITRCFSIIFPSTIRQ